MAVIGMSSGRSPRKTRSASSLVLVATSSPESHRPPKAPGKMSFHVYIGALLAAARRSDTDVVRNRRPSPSDWTVSRKTMECAGSTASRSVIAGSEPPRKKVNSTPRGGAGT